MTNLSEQAAATLTVPVICERWDCIVSTLVFSPYQLSSYFLFYGSLALSACMTVCAASCKQGGLQGSRFATQRSSIKTNKAKKEQCQDPWNQRPGSGPGFVPRGWVRFAGAGGLSAEKSVWSLCMQHASSSRPLKSACFCPLHNLIEFFEQLIRMHFVSKRVGEGGRQKCPHPEFHRRATGRPTWLATGGNDGHERAKSIASMHVFELWQLFANLMTMAGRSRIPLRPRTLWWSSLCCQLPRWEKREWVEEEKLFVSWNLIFFCDFINFDYLHFAVISVWVNVHTVCLRWINAITWHDLNSKKSWNALRCKTSYFHILWTVEQTFQLRSLHVYSVHLDVAFSLSDHITASASADCRSHDDQN